LFTESGAPYESGVFYCKDAFEGLDTMEKLIDPAERGDFVGRIIAEAEEEAGKLVDGKLGSSKLVMAPRQSTNYQPTNIPTPPFWGSRVIREMPLEIVLQHLDVDELYRLQWGAKNKHGDEWVKLKAEFDARLDRMKREAIRSGYLKPQAVYGYFPAQSSGDTLIVYDPQAYAGNGHKTTIEIARFEFPRQQGQDHLALSDYFAPVESGITDVVAFQVVTVGHGADQKFQELQGKGDYSEAYFLHGLSVEAAEATAEYVHQHVRRELNLDVKRGKRYSWGYPACPDLADHQKVFALLPQANELGLELSAAYQLIPEQSTAAIVVHHPAAKYYAVGVSRVEQLLGA
jgi:5-methyltetrahydrofolate--homocysteine methyltransferase